MKRAEIFTGGAKKTPVAYGAALALRERRDEFGDFGLVYGGSGNSITAACVVGDQVEKLYSGLRNADNKGLVSLGNLLRCGHFLDLDRLMAFYESLNLDIGKILDSTRRLIIPITNFDTGGVEWCSNQEGPGVDFVMETEADLMDIVRISQTMPLVGNVRSSLFSTLPMARRGDSYNSSSVGLMLWHANQYYQPQELIVVDTTLKPNSERDLAFVAPLLVRKDAYKQELGLRRQIESLGLGDNVHCVDLQRPFPVESIFSGETDEPNLVHGYRATQKWIENWLANS